MSERVLKGDVRVDNLGRRFVVLRTERGRAGESRTMVLLGTCSNPDTGIVYEMETRALSWVARSHRIGRGRVSVKDLDRGEWYFSPKYGLLP